MATDKEIQDKIEETIDNLLLKFCVKVVEDAKENVASAGHVDTGFLMSSISFRKLGPLQYRIISAAPYSGFLEYGTVAHEIRAKNKKALAFEIGKGARLASKGPVSSAEIVIVKSVQHPGTSPSPFMEPAVHLNLDRLRNGEFFKKA